MYDQPLDEVLLAQLKRRDQRLLKNEPAGLIHLFMMEMKKANPKVLEPRSAWRIAATNFERKEIDADVAAESSNVVAGMDRIKALVRAILRYMDKAGKVHLYNSHYYWPEYDYINKSRKRRKYESAWTDDDVDEPEEEDNYDGPVINIRPPAPDNRSGR